MWLGPASLQGHGTQPPVVTALCPRNVLCEPFGVGVPQRWLFVVAWCGSNTWPQCLSMNTRRKPAASDVLRLQVTLPTQQEDEQGRRPLNVSLRQLCRDQIRTVFTRLPNGTGTVEWYKRGP